MCSYDELPNFELYGEFSRISFNRVFDDSFGGKKSHRNVSVGGGPGAPSEVPGPPAELYRVG